MTPFSNDNTPCAIESHAEHGRVHVRARVFFMGGDICILLDGGQKPHTGALCIASAHGIHTHSLAQHKEGELAQEIATQLHAHFNTTVTCLCGIHIPHITKEEITMVYTLSHQLLISLKEKIQNFVHC